MAVAIRRERNRKLSDRPAAEPARTPVIRSRDVEAPDAGVLTRPSEAPDAGEGRAAFHEHEFTHGRSQS